MDQALYIIAYIGMFTVIVGEVVLAVTVISGIVGFIKKDYKFFKKSLKVFLGCLAFYVLIFLAILLINFIQAQ